MPDTAPTTPEVAASTPAAVVSAEPASPVTPSEGTERRNLSDAEIEQLVNFSNLAYEELEKLTPYKEKIKRLAEDEEYRKFVESATSHYDQGHKELEQQRAAEIPSWAKPMLDFVESQKQNMSRQQEADQNKFYAEQRAVGDRLQRENSLTPAQISDLAYHADSLATRYQRRVGLEEAYNHMRGFAAPTAHGAPPTVGLRGDASQPGVPGRSSNADDFVKDFHSSTLALLRNGKG